MSLSNESRIEQRAATLRIRFDRRIVLTSFAACFVLGSVYFLWLDPEVLALLTGPGAFAFTLAGIPGLSLLGFFFLRIALNPFIDGYYEYFWRKWHTDIAVSEVLAEELSARSPGYLDRAQQLLTVYQVSPVLAAPVTHRAFGRLLDADQLEEAIELGARMGLPSEVVNLARRRMLAKWDDTNPDSKEVQEIRKVAAALLSDFDAIDVLVRNILGGEPNASTKGQELVQSYAARLAPIQVLNPETMEKNFPAATMMRIAQVHLLLGQAFLCWGDRYQARCHLERAAELNREDGQASLLLSRVHYDQQNYPLALSVIERHLERFPGDDVARYHREDCVRALGRG